MRWYRNRLPDLPRITRITITEPSRDAVEAEEWLRATSRPTPCAPPAMSSDFTARVMARLDTPAAAPSRAPVALSAHSVRPSQRRHFVRALRPLGIVGGIIGFSGALVVVSLAVALLVAPSALVALLNTLVGFLVAVVMLTTPLLDAAGALASNNALMTGLTVLIASFVLVWSRTSRASGQLAREA